MYDIDTSIWYCMNGMIPISLCYYICDIECMIFNTGYNTFKRSREKGI